MPIALQQTMFGPAVATGSVVDQLEYILTEHPEARDSYKRTMALYWLEFDGLEAALRQALTRELGTAPDGLAEAVGAAFAEWFVQFATSPKTLQNRAMELQSDRTDLDATPDVRAWRERQSRAGPVK